jgi:hypothetical protein
MSFFKSRGNRHRLLVIVVSNSGSRSCRCNSRCTDSTWWLRDTSSSDSSVSGLVTESSRTIWLASCPVSVSIHKSFPKVVSSETLTKIRWTSRCQQLDAAGRSQRRSSSLVSPADRLRYCSIYSRARPDLGTGSGPSVPRSSVKGSEDDLSG